ncbi:MAG: YbaB/EbfC family nucleoid-associated protein [Thermoguttaceae bacterium]|jgi:DNA-binding YbaB/EbfC family protein
MFKGLGNLGALWKQAQQLGGQFEKLTEELKHRRASGTAGGQLVEIEVNGLLEVLRCSIDPQLMAQGDRELLEDLIVAAVNQAIQQGKQLHATAIKEMTGGLQIPALKEALEKLTGAEPPPPESPGETKV